MSEGGEDDTSSIWLFGGEQREGPRWGTLVRPESSKYLIVSESSKKYTVTLWLLEEEVRGEKTLNLLTYWILREELWPLCEIISQVWIYYML